ncbi:hypothetical protein [Herbiconiux ginsengi]|uniref:Aromatic ring-opening dioxygenase LigA n=1 Tax=Herbiconiux ginsengi TaxID=381665 RepID=A0A1H3TTG9_9MICO|nr:hypothetical protein [Herbiconiux ginsengi]SDZ53258.1 hypothetical protein SAMN05216554_4476 [Herbiconiux ginsengi]
MTSLPRASALRQVGGLALAAGSVFVAVGTGAWLAVSKQLRDEKIEVPGNATAFKGKRVQGPATAYVEALVIRSNAERGAGGRTFADISTALRGVDGSSDEAAELRKQSLALSTAASLRTSLMTAVLAYGVSALVTGLGALFVIAGSLLRRTAK